ncbi:uncharacterized protein LOC121848036 [Callorhinchus milii]|uniref:uncharacterized protein LOC121848036 n=1 Tax=Callorhinchus milii TaxID=7868 RepID=UPI001C3F7935|nr:uncharacterized protein LOC121848036 [Callorhinchus milii]
MEIRPVHSREPRPGEFLITVSAAQVTYGKARDFPSYGWDNEYGEMTVETPEFEAARYLTTNAEFLRFVLAGGYQTHSYWSEEGWAWRQFRQAKHPTFWVCAKGCKAHCGSGLTDYSHCQLLIAPITNGGTGTPSSRGSQQEGSLHQDKASEFSYRAMFDVLPMPWDWPVEVNYHEAKAFCAWRGPEYRLPSEAEHQRMRGTQKPSEVGVSCDPIFCEDLEQKCNMNLLFGSPTPVNMFPPSEAGFYDVSGNIWEWTEDHFNGLPGFDTVYLYDDFSAPCFDSQHTVILGGSWCSTGDEASRFARFAFRRHFFQHLGFRLAKSRGPVKTPVQRVSTDIFLPGTGMKDHPVPEETMRVVLTPSSNIQLLYETEAREQEQLDWEYGDPSQASYCRQLVRLCREAWGQRTGQHHSALVLGSGTGLTSFLLTQHFDKVIGLDYCDRFIALSQQLQASGSLGLGVKVPDHLHRDRVVFKQLYLVAAKSRWWCCGIVQLHLVAAQADHHTALYQEAAGTSKEQAERSPGGAGFYRNILPPKLYTGYCGSMYGYHPFSMGFPVSQGSYKTMSPAICHPRGSIRQPQATLGSFHPNSMLMRDNGYSLHSSYYSPPSFLGPRLFSGPSYLPPLLPPRTVDPASEMEVSAEATPESQDSGICLTSQTSSQEPSN